mgnify:CR=1 FL=1
MHSPCFTNKNFQRAFRYIEGAMAEAASSQMLLFEGRYAIACRWNTEEQSLYFYKNDTLYFRVDAVKGLIPLLKLQKSKYLEECEALFCNLVEKAGATPWEAYRYTYTDGNNNRWEIGKDSITYKPITAAQSSSGIYSGGAPRSIAISEDAFVEGETLLQAALFAEKGHSAQRSMGTAVLTQYLQDKKLRQVILEMHSPEKEAIEAWLKALWRT